MYQILFTLLTTIMAFSCLTASAQRVRDDAYSPLFQTQEAGFFVQPPGVAGERAVSTDDTVAGYDDRDRVMAYCPSNRLR